MRVIPVGARALLVEVADTTEAQALYAQARSHQVDVLDVVPGARTVLFDGVDDPDRLVAQLAGWPPAPEPPEGPVVSVPTRYDGPDLEEVARCWGMTRPEVVATHTGTAFTVAFCGFSPGFAYCTGLPVSLSVPRRATPRPLVPAGAVGLADTFTAVYPRESPGGWQVIGRCELPVWDSDRDPPALLAPGTRVRFTALDP